MAEKIFGAQSNYGWGLTLNMTGKAPAVSKRIFDTLADAQAFANDYNDSAIEGLLLSVVADSDNNGVYFVKSIKTAVDADAAVLEKLSSGSAASGELSDALAALDLTDTAVDGEYVSKVSQEDGKIAVDRVKFADAVVAKDAEGNNVKLSEKFTAIDEAIADAKDAAIAAGTKFNLASGEAHLELSSTTSDAGSVTYTLKSKDVASAALVGSKADKSGTDTVFGHIDAAKVAAANAQTAADNAGQAVAQEVADRQTAINTEIENRGKAIDALKTELTGTLAEGDAATIAGLNAKIKEVEDASKSYSIVEVTEGLGANIEKAYQLQETVNGKSELVGSLIELQKDDSLVSVALVDADGVESEKGQYLQFIYNLSDGTEKTVKIDVTHFLAESEFKNGLQVSESGEVSVKVDADSEGFLTVGEGGVKLAGVQDAIDAAELAAKQHATDLDSALQARVKTIEDNYLDGDDKTELANAISAEATTARAAEQANAAAIVTNRQEIEAIITENERVVAEALTNLDSRVIAIEDKNDTIDSALQASDITTGSAPGTIAVKGSNVAVAGLKSAAYTESSAYATAAQGAKADAAAPQATTYTKTEVDAMLSWFEG